MLKEVLGQLKQLRETRGTLDERKRQLTQAEDRLSKAEALLEDVHSSVQVLEGQKALVDQAVEKAGSLQSLLRQAEAAIGNLRETTRAVARPKSGRGAKSGGATGTPGSGVVDGTQGEVDGDDLAQAA